MESIYKLCTIGDVPLFVDPYMEDNKLLKGRNTEKLNTFMIANLKTATAIYNAYLKTQRRLKLKQLKWTNLE